SFATETARRSGAGRADPGIATARRAALVRRRPTIAGTVAAAAAHTRHPLAGGVGCSSAGRARALAGAAPGGHHPVGPAGAAAAGALLPGVAGLGPDLAIARAGSNPYGSAQRQPHRHRLFGR